MAGSRTSWFIVAAAVVLLVACHTITEEAPTEPSPVSEEPKVGAITIPIILPASNPTPAPTPAPPAPTPQPTPETPPGDANGCGAPPNNPPESSLTCTDDPPHFLAEVETAITAVTDGYPELFDINNKKCANCYFVKDVDRYAGLVVQELSAMGFCARWDGEEVAVKRTNNFSEQYDIILSSNHIRRGPGSYRGVCSPSWF